MSQETSNAPFTLLKYDEPILVESNDISTKYIPPDIKSNKTEPLISPDMLKAMLPSREWKDEHGKWQQNVSTTPSSRAEVLELQDILAAHLIKEQAKKIGICANRERLHAQLFDEIIRQVTLACPERGLVLLRVRDEIRMTIEAYQALYNTSLSFGINKTILAEKGTKEIEIKTNELEKEILQLNDEITQWNHKYMVLQYIYTNENKKKIKQNENIIQNLKNQIKQFEIFQNELNK